MIEYKQMPFKIGDKVTWKGDGGIDEQSMGRGSSSSYAYRPDIYGTVVEIYEYVVQEDAEHRFNKKPGPSEYKREKQLTLRAAGGARRRKTRSHRRANRKTMRR